MAVKLALAQDKQADALLSKDPLALLIGMVLDQQIPLEWAFKGPWELQQRLGGGRLDAGRIAAMDPDELAAVFAQRPALHRFPGSMAKRVQELCRTLVEEHDGCAENVWKKAGDGRDLLHRVKALPGFGDQKARIFVALLGKQLGVQPDGWKDAAGEYAEAGSYKSVADIVDGASLTRVREYKSMKKRSGVDAK